MKRILCLALLASIGADGPPPRTVRKFTIVYNVNNGGYIDVCGCKNQKLRQGSVARRATYMKTLRAGGKPIVAVDGGSALFDLRQVGIKDVDRPQMMNKAKIIIEAYNRMEYAALAVGSGDLRLGLDPLKELEKLARFPLLSANLLDSDGKMIFKPHVIVEAGGARIAFIGLTHMNPRYLEALAPGARLGDPIEAARREVARIGDQADVYFALSHLPAEENRKLADKVPEIQFILDPNIVFGNHGIRMEAVEYIDLAGDTVLLRTDGEGMRVGKLDIEMVRPRAPMRTEIALIKLETGMEAPAFPPDLAKVNGISADENRFALTRVSIEPHMVADPDIERFIDEWKKNPGGLEVEIPKAGSTVPYQGVDVCKDCHPEVHVFWKGTAHARALESLRKGGDHLRADCIPCHTLGFGHLFVDVREAPKYAGVQCESCHGVNPKHTEDPLNARWPRVGELNCLVCHNKRQTRVDFHYSGKLVLVRCPRQQ